MLSHLVLSTKDDEQMFADLLEEESNSFILLAQQAWLEILPTDLLSGGRLLWPSGVPPIVAPPMQGVQGLRAPPVA